MQNNSPAANASPRSLVIAERARNVRQLLSRELSRDGYTVCALASGADLCRELEADSSPRIILLDPDLPGLADDAVLHRLRRAAKRSHLLIHSFGAQTFAPLADMTLATINRTGNIEAIRNALQGALSKVDDAGS
ncbi:hypothetical protein DPQ33_07200 [Oceanidesulfovibrio indonesiensis]|jgi:CheY-like chemotaxis protein|uniref:Response regulatory domain-containing protein n=1 Tax=Oceanidesulfovibrio indonesiensis TaxID=54767 RepID=A0A7M3MG71_9BACT|nr:response regulator [Oceanidesulfovibrio indonesiensis]TVM17889.1 hypothetical protein DPQ33_07200 [Oceanidesulfovibrio indonesiensis]